MSEKQRAVVEKRLGGRKGVRDILLGKAVPAIPKEYVPEEDIMCLDGKTRCHDPNVKRQPGY
jgi:hypothetical protein